LYSSPSTIRIIKPKRMRWVGEEERLDFIGGKTRGEEAASKTIGGWIILG
jgi:hypothetical protein